MPSRAMPDLISLEHPIGIDARNPDQIAFMGQRVLLDFRNPVFRAVLDRCFGPHRFVPRAAPTVFLVEIMQLGLILEPLHVVILHRPVGQRDIRRIMPVDRRRLPPVHLAAPIDLIAGNLGKQAQLFLGRLVIVLRGFHLVFIQPRRRFWRWAGLP